MPFLRLFRYLVVACLLPFAATALHAQTVATPAFNPAPGPKVNSPTVTVTTSTSGATIYYTLDGSTPSATNGQVYTAPLLLNGAINTLRAVAIRSGFANSAVREGVYPVLNNGGYSPPLPTDRGRVQVAEIPDPFGTNLLGGLGSTFANRPLKVLRTDSGQSLRGASPWIYKPVVNGVATTNPNYRLSSITQSWVDRLVADRLNSVRLCFWDAYELAAGYATIGDSAVDFNNPAQVEILLAHFERWADLLSAAGIYVGVNYHNEFQKNTNEAHATAFWTVMARYFRHRTHFIFEITNEPAGTNWKSIDINNGAEGKRQVRITKAIRDIDPDRFLLVLTPAGYSGGYQFASDLDPNITTRNFANEYLSTYGVPIDWTKTAVGYHNYYDPQGTSGLIRALHREFPAFWTEAALGPVVRDAYNASSNQPKLGNLEFGPTLDGDRSNIQTAEKLGIGWWQWTTDSEDRQNRIWPFIQADAIAHDYWWEADTGIPSPPVVTSDVSANALLNQPFSYQLTASNAANAYAASNLPPGLTLNPTNGLISGTPTETGVRLVTLTATNALGSGTATLTLSVSSPEPLHTQNFDAGGTNSWFAYSGDGGVSHTLTTATNGPANSPALNLAVTVAAPPASYWYAGTGIVVATQPPFVASALSETYLSVDVRTSTSSSAEIVLVLKTPAPNEGTLSRTFTVPGGTWTTLTAPLSSFAATNFDYAAPSYEIMVQKGNSGWPLATSSLRVDNVALTRPAALPPAPVITSATVVSAARDTPFTYTLTATNSPTAFTATGLPSGLTFDPVTATISGTPTATGIATITLAATNADGTGHATLTLAVTPPVPIITSPVSVNTLQGAPFSYTITATDSPTAYGATGLPAGLSLDSSTGLISGTPTAVGTSEITLSATNLAGSGSTILSLTINPPAPVIMSAATVLTVLGVPFTYTVAASNSPTTFTATGLPAGLSFDAASATISGTPTALGTSEIALSATNITGTGQATLTLTVGLLAPLLTADFESGPSNWFAYSGDGGVTPTFNAQPNGPGGSTALNLALAVAAPPATYWYAGLGVAPPTAPPFSPATLAQTFVSLDVWVSATPSAELIVAFKTLNNGTLTRTFTVPGNTWTTLSAALSTFAASNFDYAASSFEILIQKGDTGWPLATSSYRIDNFALTQTAPTPPAPAITSASTASVAYGSPFFYTISASNSPASFSAIGLPAGLSLDSVTGVISGTPTTHGVSQITLGATNAGGTGQALLTLTVTLSPIEQWRLTYFGSPDPIGDAALDADDDGDGLSNLLEYALGSDPTTPSASQAMFSEIVDAKLQLTFLRARADVTYEVLATSDLSDPDGWQVIATNPGEVSATVPVTITDPESVSENPRRFLRLRVTL